MSTKDNQKETKCEYYGNSDYCTGLDAVYVCIHCGARYCVRCADALEYTCDCVAGSIIRISKLKDHKVVVEEAIKNAKKD